MGRKKLDPSTSAKRALILKAAGQMFVRYGYSAVSMDAIAEAVPVSKRTLYNHFNDKKALFTAVMHSRCQQVFQMLEENLMEDRPVERVLYDVGAKYMEIVLETEAVDMYRTLITEAQQFPELGRLFYASGPTRSRITLAGYLKRQHDRGVLHVPHPELAADLFIGMILNRMQMQYLLGVAVQFGAAERGEVIANAVDIFLRGTAAGVRSEKKPVDGHYAHA